MKFRALTINVGRRIGHLLGIRYGNINKYVKQHGINPEVATQLQRLNSRKSLERLTAIGKLAELKDSHEAMPIIIKVLKDVDFYVRIAAAKTLGKMGRGEAGAPLLQALQTPDDPRIHIAIVKALGQIKSAEAVKPLLEIARQNENVSDGGSNRTKCELIEEAIQALGGIGDAQAIDTLKRIVMKNGFSTGRPVAAVALGEIGEKICPPERRPLIDTAKSILPDWYTRDYKSEYGILLFGIATGKVNTLEEVKRQAEIRSLGEISNKNL